METNSFEDNKDYYVSRYQLIENNYNTENTKCFSAFWKSILRRIVNKHKLDARLCFFR